MHAWELTDDDRADGYIGYYSNDDQTVLLAVVRVDLGEYTFDNFAETIGSDESVENVARKTVNGLPAVTYSISDNDTLNIAVADGEHCVLEVTMAPASAEGMEELWKLVSASIQAAPAE